MDHPKQSDNYRGGAGYVPTSYGSAVYLGVGALRFCLYYTVAALEWPRGTFGCWEGVRHTLLSHAAHVHTKIKRKPCLPADSPILSVARPPSDR